MVNPMLKLAFSLVALVAAFIFTFILPGVGFEFAVLKIAAAVAAQIGLTSWRKEYDLIAGWMKSRTIVGALVVVVPIIVCVVLPYAWATAPAWIYLGASIIAALGGGTMFFGILGIKKPELPEADTPLIQ